nr:glycosyltransferase family 2 protein [uncultured Pedobacter sp.]
MKKISVVICVFNEEYCILEALRSIKNNEIYNEVEIILVNDCSSNPVTLRLLNLLKKFNRYIIIHSPKNLGLSNSRNLGFQTASSSFVAPLDADDTLPAHALDKIYQVFTDYPNVGFVFGDYILYNEDSKSEKEVSGQIISTGNRLDVKKVLNNWILMGQSPCRKDVWSLVNGYANKYTNSVQDADFWIRVFEKGVEGHYIPELIYKWNRSSNGMNETFDRKDYYLMLEEHYSFIKKFQSAKTLANTISEGFYKRKMLLKMLVFNAKHLLLLNYKNILRPLILMKQGLFKR